MCGFAQWEFTKEVLSLWGFTKWDFAKKVLSFLLDYGTHCYWACYIMCFSGVNAPPIEAKRVIITFIYLLAFALIRAVVACKTLSAQREIL